MPSSINDRTRQGCVLSDRLDQLDSDFFNRLRTYLLKKVILSPEKKEPHETQQEAIDKALEHFKDNSRGQMILPCGTGKTLAAMWIAEKLGRKHILVMVPSLALLSQTLREWAANTSLNPFRYLCLCSDTTVDLGNDSPVEHLYEMDVQVTTNVNAVSDYLEKEADTTSVLFSTYQSSKVLSEACLKAGIHFDVGLFDEAHRTTGTHASVWSIALDDKNVPIKKRVFMTATPRIYAPHITKKAEEDDILVCSMDDHNVYGKPFYKMSFGEAVKRDLITDYKVVVICVTDSEVRDLINKRGKIITEDNHELDAKALAKRVALVKAFDAYGFKKIFTFHSRVAGAKAFTDVKSPYGMKQSFEMLNSNLLKENNMELFHVNGTMSSGERNGYMKEFKDAEIGIMSNARCLTEGVDIPLVDAIAFIDPKRSIIDIVQATGRAMRKAEWKEKGYIFIPVVVDEDTNPEIFLESSGYKTVWQVLQAMVDSDNHLQDIVSRLRTLQGMGEVDSKEWKAAMTEYCDKFEFFNLPNKIDQDRFIKTLYTKAIEVISRSWDFWYGLTLKYKLEYGDANAPQSYKTPKGFDLGKWQARQRVSYRKGTLDNKLRVQKLAEIGFVWEPHEEAFEQGYQETLKYKNKWGNANALYHHKTPKGFALGIWQNTQWINYNKGKLNKERVSRLEEIGFIWNQLEEVFKQGYQEILKYKNKWGNANALYHHKTPEGFALGIWQNTLRQNYRKGELGKEMISRLEEIGFIWNLRGKGFEKGYQETLKYKKQYGNANALYSYKTPEGFDLGIWQNTLRVSYRKGILDKLKILKLEETGFLWKLR